MFDQLFERSHALARQRAGPLVAERLGYLRHLADQGMTRKTLRAVAYYLLIVAKYLHLADRPDEAVTGAEIVEKARRWASRPPRRKQRPSARARFIWHATQWLSFLGRLQEPPTQTSPHAKLIAAFADYLHRERSLSPQTIYHRCWAVQRFLDRLAPSPDTLREISITQIDETLVEKVTSGGYARVTVQTLATNLRSFFLFAEMRGWCRRGLAAAIMAPRVFPQEALPAGPSWDEVQRLLATTEGDHPTNVRDRAILMLLTVYGLRAGEVAHLHLEDFDWEAELLCVTRSKTQRTRTYPLSHTVGEAVLRYLREVRPHSACREVFLTRRAPVRPLFRGGVTELVIRRMQSLGLSLPHYGPHALRHACATHLLSQGLSLKEIGDHLGHRLPDTTRIYAKVDLRGLRQVADFDLGGLL